MSNSDLISLYSGPILELAANIPLSGRLSAAQGSAKRRSPACGSSITVDLNLAGNAITEFAQEVRACALGQASASIFAASVIGRSPAEIGTLRQEVAAMLKEGAEPPRPPFDNYRLLVPARDFANRHASILLVLDATLAAIDEAEGRPGA